MRAIQQHSEADFARDEEPFDPFAFRELLNHLDYAGNHATGEYLLFKKLPAETSPFLSDRRTPTSDGPADLPVGNSRDG